MKVKCINENFKDHYLKNLLATRGVEDMETFLNPPYSCLEDPKWLWGIEEGAKWLEATLNKPDSKILLVVDSDVDGYTSGAIMWNYIKAIAPSQDITYVLHNNKQHGLQDHSQAILDGNVQYDLIILPDSSSNDYEYHEMLKTRCLVLDHHEIDDNQPLSQYACIINNQMSPTYGNKDLTGAGVAWQFCRYHEQFTTSPGGVAGALIDLAALGICGDMGSVLSLENRYIMQNGFANISNYFFQCAVEKQSYSMGDTINPMAVAFYIVPMMNAMIRVGSMDEKKRLFEALIDGERMVPSNKRGAKGSLEHLAVESIRECLNAKAKQNRITDQMVGALEQKIFKYDLLENKILFVRLEDENDYPPEVVGLCAMKLAAAYKRPTIVARLNDEGYDRGSIRNVSDCELTDLKAFLNDSGYFEYVQGHANAAGCSIKDDKLREFHAYANEALKDIDFSESTYDVNFERTVDDADLADLIYELGSYPELWGQNNSEPLIFIHDIMVNEDDIRIMGANKDTLKIEKNGISFLKFHAKDMIEELNRCNEIKLNIVGKANINEWMGQQSPQIFIENYEIVDNLLEF